MGMYSKAKRVVKIFFKSPQKIDLLKEMLKALKNEGISGLKCVIKNADKAQEYTIGLYEKQQSISKRYEEYEESVLFVIWAMQKDVDIDDTYNLTFSQKKQQDRIIVLKTAETAGWEDRINCEKRICDTSDITECLQELVMECQHDYVFFIKAGNYFAPNMRDEFARVIHEKSPAIVYSDECVFAHDNGNITRYDIKPNFSLYDLCQDNYAWQSIAFKNELLRKLLKDFPLTECMESMLLYLILQSAEETIVHVDQVLLLKKDILQVDNITEKRCLIESYLKKKGIPVNVIIENSTLRLCSYRCQYKASIIILAEQLSQIKECLRDLVYHTANAEYELIVVGESEVLEKMQFELGTEIHSTSVICDKEMTYTERCNTASKYASGDILVFMQEDMRVQHVEWLSELLGVYAFPQVGAVSPKILRADNTIRYAGIIAGGFGFTPIPFNGEFDQRDCEKNNPAFINRQVAVLSASCLSIRKDVFEKVGGFNILNFTDKFSNAQLSFEITRAGYRCVYCADSRLVSKGEAWYDSWYDKEHSSAYLNLLKEYGEELSEDDYFTQSMKHQYLRGVPIDFRIYQKKKENKINPQSILMVSHDSLLGGATIAFQYAARALKKQGYNVVWLVEQNGPMLQELENDEIGYIVDSSFKGSDGWINYAKNFDLIICSTIVLYSQVEKIKNLGKKIIWWIHEAKEYYSTEIFENFSRENLKNLNVWCGGTFAQKVFTQHFPNIETEVMLYGVPDYARNKGVMNVDCDFVIDNPMNRMIFLSIGTIEKRKGQDILVEAIKKLDAEVRENCLFVFLGKPIHEDVFLKVEELVDEYPNSAVYMKPVDRNTLMNIYQQGEVVLCTSREDPMPVFMTECMMQSKIAICSENTGTAGVLTDGKDGFIYHNNSAEELAEKITYVLKHRGEMEMIRANARNTYEKSFSMEVFEEKLRVSVTKILEE